MKILVYGINYYPECIGIGKYSSEMCEWLACKGHTVEVITAMPFYPDWKVMEDYKRKLWYTELINGVSVHRCPLYVPSKVTGFTRIIQELSFVLSSSIYWFKLIFTKFDIIISIAPPLQIGLPVLIYKQFHKVISIYHIQDFQMEAAKELGLIKNQFVLKTISKIERVILNSSDFVSSISEGMINKLVSKNVSKRKLFILRNWTDTKLIYPHTLDSNIRDVFKIDYSEKIILYSGSIGEKQGLDIIIDVAEALTNHNIVFLVIGEGSFKSKFRDIIDKRGLKNIKIFPLQPLELFNEILNMADIHLVIQKRAVADLLMPSKFSTILAVGGLAIVTAEKGTTLHDLIKANDMAIVIEPENPVLLLNAILSTLDTDLTDYKRNARNYALNNLDKEVILKNFNDFLCVMRT
jgi:colanic acid biosynthesis glycosyl transferase WcaI